MRLFLTDYASYNNGTQFEFGHWVDLEQFDAADEFMEYIKEHFEEADKKSPLPCFSKREEIMFTDYEGMPKELYSESMSFKEMEQIFQLKELDDDDQLKVIFMLEQNCEFDYAIEKYEDVYMTPYNYTNEEKYDLIEQYYPDIYEISSKIPYLEVNEDHFIEENFTEFNYNNQDYLIHDSWNH